VRNVSGVPFLSCCTDADREEVEQVLRGAFAKLQGEVAGSYVGLGGTGFRV
jgi:hypothetical protein